MATIKNPKSIKSLKRASIFDTLENDFGTHALNDEGQWEYQNDEGISQSDYLEEATEHANTLDAIGAVYQRADRIITGDSGLNVTVSLSKEMDMPSMTDGKDIILNGNLIDSVDNDTIIGINGLNYHELAHALFSPRVGSALGQYVTQNEYLRAFNLLEEGRIERLLTSLYPTTTITLEAMVNDHVIKESADKWGNQFPTITGRTYLPIELRQIVADKFIAQYGLAVAQEVSSIVHEYRELSFPEGFGRAKELIERMGNLIGKDTTPKEGMPNWANAGHGDRQFPDKGRPKSGKEQSQLQSRANDGEKENLTEQQGSEFGTGAGWSEDTTENYYAGEEKKLTAEEQKVADLIANRIKDIKNDKRVLREVSETRKAVQNSTNVNIKLPKQSTTDMNVTPTALNYARKFGRELERIVRDLDPKWDTHLPSGKLNVSRTMNPDVNTINEMFDVWDTGSDSTEIEASILIDNSGSMWGLMNTVCEQAWIIKRGIESIDGSVSVYNFNSVSKVVYEPTEKANPKTYRYVQNTGWTNPYRALVETERTMNATDKANRVVFIITDGQWEKTQECDTIIKRMKDKGILIVVVYLTNGLEGIKEYTQRAKDGDEGAIQYLKSLNHNADVFKAVSEPKHTLELANEIVKNVLKSTRKVA